MQAASYNSDNIISPFNRPQPQTSKTFHQQRIVNTLLSLHPHHHSHSAAVPTSHFNPHHRNMFSISIVHTNPSTFISHTEPHRPLFPFPPFHTLHHPKPPFYDTPFPSQSLSIYNHLPNPLPYPQHISNCSLAHSPPHHPIEQVSNLLLYTHIHRPPPPSYPLTKQWVAPPPFPPALLQATPLLLHQQHPSLPSHDINPPDRHTRPAPPASTNTSPTTTTRRCFRAPGREAEG